MPNLRLIDTRGRKTGRCFKPEQHRKVRAKREDGVQLCTAARQHNFTTNHYVKVMKSWQIDKCLAHFFRTEIIIKTAFKQGSITI